MSVVAKIHSPCIVIELSKTFSKAGRKWFVDLLTKSKLDGGLQLEINSLLNDQDNVLIVR